MMIIMSAEWTPRINYYIIHCSCGRQFRHPSNRWWVQCDCGKKEHVEKLRKIWRLFHDREIWRNLEENQ